MMHGKRMDLLQELIETLWNVNDCRKNRLSPQMRINRDIVECKFDRFTPGMNL